MGELEILSLVLHLASWCNQLWNHMWICFVFYIHDITISVLYWAYLHMKCSLGISNFLEEISSLSHSIVSLYFFALITEEEFLISPCYSLELCIQMGISFLFSFAFCFSSWKDWRQEEKGMTEDEMVRWHHQLNGHEFEQALGVGDEQGSLVCCSPWGHKESDTTEWLNWTNTYFLYYIDHPSAPQI